MLTACTYCRKKTAKIKYEVVATTNYDHYTICRKVEGQLLCVHVSTNNECMQINRKPKAIFPITISHISATSFRTAKCFFCFSLLLLSRELQNGYTKDVHNNNNKTKSKKIQHTKNKHFERHIQM